MKSDQTELKPCREQFKKWWLDYVRSPGRPYDQSLSNRAEHYLTWEAAINRRSAEPEVEQDGLFTELLTAIIEEFPPEMRDTGGQDMAGNWVNEPTRNLETTLSAIQSLKEQYNTLRSGVEKVRDEAKKDSIERYLPGVVPNERQKSIGDCARRVHTYYKQALIALLNEDKVEMENENV